MKRAAGHGPRGATLLLALAGWAVWSAAFVVLYAGHAVGCRFGWNAVAFGPLALDRTLLLAAWLASVAACAWLLARLLQAPRPVEPGRFMRRLVVISTGAALVSTAWIGLPIVLTATCG